MSFDSAINSPVPAWGLPGTTVPLTADGVLNDAVGVDPVKVVTGVTVGAGRSDRVRVIEVFLPTAARQLAYTTVATGGTAPTSANMTATVAGADTNGIPILPSVPRVIVVPEECDLYLVASDATTKFHLSMRTAVA